MCKCRQSLSVVVVCLLTMPAAAQQPSALQRLRIIPLEGHNAINYLSLRTGTAPVVEVRDENDRPVEGAIVTFKLPASGAGATFQNGQTTYTATTDFRGQAGSSEYTPNRTPGRFTVEITATEQDRTARFLMVQTNSIEALPAGLGGPKQSNKWKWVLLSVAVGAGAGLGIYFGTRGNTSPISVGTGPVVVGGPR
jgi:hypothetical protein